jgi:hypothetical protein
VTPAIATATIEEKQRQFNAAMARYETGAVYKFTGFAVAVVNVGMQPIMLWAAMRSPVAPSLHATAFAAAYVLADLVNGFIHMLLDNSDGYTSISGPFVAAFHLHHRTPVYRKRNVLLVYFFESGSKIWLAFCTIAAAALMWHGLVPPFAALMLVYFSILSCLAEVSHYYCHTPTPVVPKMLASAWLLLPKRYHARHHIADNTRYAFLNGMSNPVLNVIARLFFKGYKTTTDLHYAAYTGKDTANRS